MLVDRGPITQQHGERLRLLRYRPVELRGKIIEPTLLEPVFNIGVEFVVLTKACDAFRTTIRARQTERADTNLDPRFFGVNGAIERAHQLVDVVASPVGAVKFDAVCFVALPRGVVGEVEIVSRFGRGRESWCGSGFGRDVWLRILPSIIAFARSREK